METALENDRYAIQHAGRHAAMPGSYLAVNRAQKLLFGFSGDGVHVRPEGAEGAAADWELEMSLCGIGYGDLTDATSEGRLAASGNRIHYQRVTATGKSFTEWYVNTPRGLEQGFTLQDRPGARRNPEDPLVVEFRVSGGLRPNLAENRKSIAFAAADGKPAFQYSELCAYDANGTELSSRMVVREGLVALAVDDSRATYPLTIDPLFTTETKLTSIDIAESDHFGDSVAVSGDTALVGAPGDDGAGLASGAAYVFVRSGTTWSQQAKLTVNAGAADAEFGNSVALSGDTALVGAWKDNAGANPSGSAFVFVRSGTTWSQQARLTKSDAQSSDGFGISVALSGDTAVVGALEDDEGVSNSGSAHVFVRSGTTWSQQAKLKANDAAESDHFGVSVALSKDTALVGAIHDDDAGSASGSAYVFVRSGTAWSQQGKLTANDAATGNQFGRTVALSGDTALVGAIGDDDAGSASGSAYVFVRSGTAWSQQDKLTANDGAAFDFFGDSVAINGDTALVGAIGDDDVASASGSVYVFVRSGTTWSQQDKLAADDGAIADNFGRAIALSEDTALIGALVDDAGRDSGAVYIYEAPRDPAILLQDLIQQVQAVNTNNNIANNSLEAKLDAAVQALEDLNNNNDAAAINALNAFISAVQAQSGKSISTAEADALIAVAERIIDLIEGS